MPHKYLPFPPRSLELSRDLQGFALSGGGRQRASHAAQRLGSSAAAAYTLASAKVKEEKLLNTQNYYHVVKTREETCWLKSSQKS